MKDICEGRRTKNDVVYEGIQMYSEVFRKANREVNRLVEVFPVLSEADVVVSTVPSHK
jgi:hypothetical protein